MIAQGFGRPSRPLSRLVSYLATYRPITATPHGRRAVQDFGIPPFVDASCRREPDFQSPFPSISGLCRGRLFAPRLRPGDQVVYLTKKGRYGAGPRHWRFVAVLEVLQRFESHDQAAGWYLSRGLELPTNCIVDGHAPLALERTGGPRGLAKLQKHFDPETIVRSWDSNYRKWSPEQEPRQTSLILGKTRTRW